MRLFFTWKKPIKTHRINTERPEEIAFYYQEMLIASFLSIQFKSILNKFIMHQGVLILQFSQKQ